MDVHERQLLQGDLRLQAVYAFCRDYRVQPGVRESEDNLMQIATTKISAGVSTGIGEHGGGSPG